MKVSLGHLYRFIKFIIIVKTNHSSCLNGTIRITAMFCSTNYCHVLEFWLKIYKLKIRDSQYYITYYIYYTDTCYIQGGAILVLSQSASPDRRYGQS